MMLGDKKQLRGLESPYRNCPLRVNQKSNRRIRAHHSDTSFTLATFHIDTSLAKSLFRLSTPASTASEIEPLRGEFSINVELEH